MNQTSESSRLNCGVADMLHKATEIRNFQEVDALKNAVDHLNEYGPERPCNVRLCASLDNCKNIADIAFKLQGICYPAKEQAVTVVVRMPENPESV